MALQEHLLANTANGSVPETASFLGKEMMAPTSQEHHPKLPGTFPPLWTTSAHTNPQA